MMPCCSHAPPIWARSISFAAKGPLSSWPLVPVAAWVRYQGFTCAPMPRVRLGTIELKPRTGLRRREQSMPRKPPLSYNRIDVLLPCSRAKLLKTRTRQTRWIASYKNLYPLLVFRYLRTYSRCVARSGRADGGAGVICVSNRSSPWGSYSYLTNSAWPMPLLSD